MTRSPKTLNNKQKKLKIYLDDLKNTNLIAKVSAYLI